MSDDVPATPSNDGGGPSPRAGRRHYESISDWNRRYVLSLLEEDDGGMSEEELAIHVAASEHDKPARLVTDDELDPVLARLRHVHLPKLAAAGLIEREGNGVVASTGTPATVERPTPLVGAAVEDREEPIDEVFAALADPIRRTLLPVLADRNDDRLSVEDAAEAVADRSASSGDDLPEDVERIALSLHHQHLPKLDEAGIVTYDADAGIVAYDGHPALQGTWV